MALLMELRGVSYTPALKNRLDKNNVAAVYKDPDLKKFEPEKWNLLVRNIGILFDVFYKSADVGIIILRVK
jgi:hypothetical protein